MPSWFERAAVCRKLTDAALENGTEEQAVAALGDLAGDEDASVREVCLRSLARLSAGARQAVLEVLMVAIDDPVESVRVEAFKAMGAAAERGCELSVPMAQHEARSQDSPTAVRVEAVRVLEKVAEVGDWSTLGQLALEAQEGAVALRRAAVQALSALAPPGDARVVAFLAGRAAPFLPACPDEEAAAALKPHAEGLGSSRDPDWQVRVAALSGMARLAGRDCQRACDAAEEAAKDQRMEVRVAAAKVLQEVAPLGDLEMACVLAAQCKDSSTEVRKAALRALQVLERGEDPHETAVRACLECWECSLANADVRTLALQTAVALVGPGNADVVKFVAKGLEANSPEARSAAAEGLAEVTDGPSPLLVSQVVRRIIDDRAPVRKDAVTALGKVLPHGHPMVVEELVGHVEKPDEAVRKIVLEALQKFARQGDEAAAKAISTRLWDPNPGVRIAALKAIAEVAPFDDDNYITRACLCLEDDDKGVREAVAETLPKMCTSRNRTAVQCLTHCIRNTMKYPKRENTREAACLAMAKWAEKGSEEAVYVLCGTISQDYPQATVAALRALPEVARPGDRAALDGAASALSHKEQRSRATACEVLEQLADRGSVAPASASTATGFEGRWTGGSIKGKKIIWGGGDVITSFEVRPGRVLTTVCSDQQGREFPAWARLDAYDVLRWDFGAEWRRLDGERQQPEQEQQQALEDELTARAAALERQIFGDEVPAAPVLAAPPAAVEAADAVDAGDVYAVAAVAAHFRSEDEATREAAVSALPRVVGKGSQAALDALLPMMTDTSILVRIAAVEALVAVAARGERRAIDALKVRLEDQECLKDKETGLPKGSSVGMTAAKALKKVVTSKEELAEIVGALHFSGPSLRGF